MAQDNNFVADIHTATCRCDSCNGIGNIDVSRKELRNYIRQEARSFYEGMIYYRQWKANGDVPCVVCQGRGTWEYDF